MDFAIELLARKERGQRLAKEYARLLAKEGTKVDPLTVLDHSLHHFFHLFPDHQLLACHQGNHCVRGALHRLDVITVDREGGAVQPCDADHVRLPVYADETGMDRVANQSSPSANVQLAADVGLVGFHGLHAQAQLVSDLTVGVALAQ